MGFVGRILHVLIAMRVSSTGFLFSFSLYLFFILLVLAKM